MNRLLADLKEDCHGDVVGGIKLPHDSVWWLEAIAAVIEEFAKSSGVPSVEVCDDLKRVLG